MKIFFDVYQIFGFGKTNSASGLTTEDNPMCGNELNLLNKKRVAEKLGVSESSIERWAKSGQIPPPREFGDIRIGWLSTEIDEWIKSRPVAASYSNSEKELLLRGVFSDE